MAPLVGTLIEVQSIDETVPADVFINEQATEANFKKNASDYNVLHLAMHTIMKDDDPLYSLLAFSDVEEDTVEDNRLYAYENIQPEAECRDGGVKCLQQWYWKNAERGRNDEPGTWIHLCRLPFHCHDPVAGDR
jgi:hypothetical protein